jgi:hypothetical protein
MEPTTKRGTPSLSDQWRRALAERQARTDAPVLVELPSGLSVEATRPSLLLLLRTGRIPDALAPRVEQLIATAQSGGEDAVRVALSTEHRDNPAGFYAEWVNLLDTVWLAAVAEPRFGPAMTTDPDLIPVDQVSEDDKTYLFMWCQGVASDVLAGFRAGGDRDRDRLPDRRRSDRPRARDRGDGQRRVERGVRR